MNLAEKAFSQLFPDKEITKEMIVKYSRAFNAFNANVRYTESSMIFRLSYDWKNVSDEIKMGLIQSLLLKVYNEKKRTINIELYENFIRNIGDYSESKESDPVLEQSFDRVNEKYFYGMLSKPNLKWGGPSFSKLGSYEYGSNTITISSIFRSNEAKAQELLDYIMYHEMLHKKHKFKNYKGKNYHHTRKFRESEKAFDNPNIEDELKRFIRKNKVRKVFSFKRSFWNFF